jgi:hypothetical protein
MVIGCERNRQLFAIQAQNVAAVAIQGSGLLFINRTLRNTKCPTNSSQMPNYNCAGYTRYEFNNL